MSDNAGQRRPEGRQEEADESRRLIEELLATGRQPESTEIDQIIVLISTAPFEPREIRAPLPERHLRYGQHSLAGPVPSLIDHLIKRVVVERQWAPGTTAQQYVRDIQQAVRHPAARLIVYVRRGGTMAAALVPTERVIPAGRRGRRTRRNFAVIYSVDRGTIITAYQYTDETTMSIPRDARWLKQNQRPTYKSGLRTI
jgi:hypothetical protein